MSYKIAVFVLAIVVVFTWIVPMINPNMRGVYVYENIVQTINGISRPAVDLIQDGMDYLMKDQVPKIETVLYASVPYMYRGDFWPLAPDMSILGRASLSNTNVLPNYAIKISGNSYFTYLVGSLLFNLTDINPEDYTCYIAVSPYPPYTNEHDKGGQAMGIMLYNNTGFNRSLRMADRYAIHCYYRLYDGWMEIFDYDESYYRPTTWFIDKLDGNFYDSDVDLNFSLVLRSLDSREKMILTYEDALKWYG